MKIFELISIICIKYDYMISDSVPTEQMKDINAWQDSAQMEFHSFHVDNDVDEIIENI